MNPFLLCVVAAGILAGCSTPRCDDATCTGCCDSQGRCQRGDQPTVCGQFGGACASCSPSQLCPVGVCADPAQIDAGPPPVCIPPAAETATDVFARCVAFNPENICPAEQASQELFAGRTCASSGVPRLRSDCGEFTGWTHGSRASVFDTQAECWYLDGGLVGYVYRTDTGTQISGLRPTDPCSRDAGCATCSPPPTADVACLPLSFRSTCAASSSAHVLSVCARSGVVTRGSCGALESWTEASPGSVDECFFEDGGLVGFSHASDGGSFVSGRWSFACVVDGGC